MIQKIVVLAVMLTAVITGCASPRLATTQGLPNGAVVIENHTAYRLNVSCDSAIVAANGNTSSDIAPGRSFTLSGPSIGSSGNVSVVITAFEDYRMGCIPLTRKIGIAKRTLQILPGDPARVIAIRKWNLE
jgi:hypothetical protein